MAIDRLAWRAIAARPLRSLLTILGISLGVAVLSASLTLGAALDQAVDRTVHDLVGRADLRVSGFLESGLSEQSVATISDAAGVVAAAPVIEHRTFPSDGPLSSASNAVTVLGIDPTTYRQLHDLPLVAGRQLDALDEPVALVSEELATEDGYTLGSDITLLGAGGVARLHIVGIVAGFGPLGGNGRSVVLPIDTARTAFALAGATRVDLQLAPGADASVRRSLAERMGQPYVLSSPSDVARSLRASSASFQGTAALVAAIVLFVGAFLIVNTLSMTVGERAREVGLLRAAGATRRQVSRFVFSGALLLGLVGAVVGSLAGGLLALLLVGAVTDATGLVARISSIDLPRAATAGAVGLGVTVMAAIEPALTAARISPIEALRARFDLPGVRRVRLAWIAFIFVVVAILATFAWRPVITGSGEGQAMVVYAVLLVATLLSPALLPPLARVLAVPVGVVLRLEERLARGSIARDRSRAALTLSSLVIGLSMIVALGWSAQAARSAAFDWITNVIPGDDLVSSIRPVAADEPVRNALAEVPGVARVSPIASFDLAFRGVRVDAAAIVGGDFLADGRLTFVDGDRLAALTDLDRGAAAILPAGMARTFDLQVGDSMRIPIDADHDLGLRVVGIVERSMPGSSGDAMLVGWKDATESIGVKGADAFAVRFAPNADASARATLSETARTYALEANPIERIQGAVSDALARVFGVFDALALVAVVVAALGIVNTLTMGVVERVREIGVLRAIGMSRRQVLRMVVVEASVLGVVGVFLGGLTGIAAGALLLQLGGGLGKVSGLPWPSLAVAAVLGLILPAIASIYPARLAARVSIVEALHFD